MKDLHPKQVKAIIDFSERMKRYDELKKIATKLNTSRLDELVELVNKILERNNIEDRIDRTQIKFNPYYIGNIELVDKKLSEIIFNKIYPKPELETYAHYTTFKGACGILEDKEFWIFNLLKNFEAEEFKLFRNHRFIGLGLKVL